MNWDFPTNMAASRSRSLLNMRLTRRSGGQNFKCRDGKIFALTSDGRLSSCAYWQYVDDKFRREEWRVKPKAMMCYATNEIRIGIDLRTFGKKMYGQEHTRNHGMA
jgi:hypothetical protein